MYTSRWNTYDRRPYTPSKRVSDQRVMSTSQCNEDSATSNQSRLFEDSILATTQAICRRWGSDGGVDDWSRDDEKQPGSAVSGIHRQQKKSDNRSCDWSIKSLPVNEQLEQ